jgi:hypothetical protein
MVSELEPLTIVVRGKHDSGRTSVANLIKMSLEEAGFRLVGPVKDTPPLPPGEKDQFSNRLRRNMDHRPICITVELG